MVLPTGRGKGPATRWQQQHIMVLPTGRGKGPATRWQQQKFAHLIRQNQSKSKVSSIRIKCAIRTECTVHEFSQHAQ